MEIEMKKTMIKLKALALILTVTLLAGILAMPIWSVAEGIESLEATKLQDVPTSVPDYVNKVEKNPHDVEVSVKAYPILTSDRYETFVYIGDTVNGVNFSGYSSDDISPYYSTSIGVWYNHNGLEPYGTSSLLESNVRYRDSREYILHPGLELTDGTLMVHLESEYLKEDPHTDKNVTSRYLTDTLMLDPEQLIFRIGATMRSGCGYIRMRGRNFDERLAARIHGADSFTAGHLDVPYTYLTDSSKAFNLITFEAIPNYTSDYTTTVMTGMHFALIDDTSPTVAKSSVKKYDNPDGTGDLEVTLTMNEGIRFSSMEAKNRLDELWIEVELYNMKSAKRSTARLHLKELEGKTMTFRGNIGLYNYNNFRVSRISKVNIPTSREGFDTAYVDVVDGLCVSAYEVKEYRNGYYNSSVLNTTDYDYSQTSLITDHAGNPIQPSSITNWTLGDQSYVKNSFEAVKVELYTDTAYAKLLDNPDPKLNSSDLFVGPASNLNAFVYLDTTLTREEAMKVSVTFNIIDEDGKPLTLYPTSSQSYKIDEVYSTGIREGTLLLFESVDLTEKMKLDVPEGGEPTVKIISMNDDIDDRTAYPHVIDPNTELYADFTAPEYSVRYVGEGTVEKEGGKNYWVSAEISIKDIQNYKKVAGLVGSTVSVSLGGGVDKDTEIRYLLSDKEALPPAEKLAENYPNGTVISEYGFSTLRFTASDGSAIMNYPILEDEKTYYLHIFLEGGEILLENLFIRVGLDDTVGNSLDSTVPELVEYIVDEIPPVVRHDKITRETVYDGTQEKTGIRVTLDFSAKDFSTVEGMQYLVGDDPNAADAVWQDIIIEPGRAATGRITLDYGADVMEDGVHSDTVWIRAVDYYGNLSEPAARQVLLSTEKPVTDVSYSTDLNRASNKHEITVKGAPAAELDGTPAYTRVYVTPVDEPEYSYLTLVATGESASILGFKGLSWYKVKIGTGDVYAEVYGPETVGDDYELTEDSLLYDLFTYYGEVKISFENGFGNMTPVLGDRLYAAASAGSYAKDPNYLIARYTSPYFTYPDVHGLDFLEITDRDNNVVVADAEKGSRAYRFNQSRKGISPMRNTRIHYAISNLQNGGYALTDFDYGGSVAELIWVDTEGGETVVSTVNGLAASADQYFLIGNAHDFGEYRSGAYYLRVTVKSHSGTSDVFESSRLVLDAETADNAGLHSYSRQSVSAINAEYESNVTWESFGSEDGNPITDLGVSVIIDGEKMRSSVFAVYSFGVTGLSLILQAPDSERTVEGMTIGSLSGFKLWNLASEPTLEEVMAEDFDLTRPPSSAPYFNRINGLDVIYDEETIPKGAEGLKQLYLHKGVNTLCYQYKMENGYISPVKYFTVTVSDYSPELNIAIDSYRISHAASANPAVINAHSVRFLVESAYSLNGEVDAELWSNYSMTVGRYGEDGEIAESLLDDPVETVNGTPAWLTDLAVGEYADFTENSYTADFPDVTKLCTAFFVARDAYGGMTVVAPQLGAERRYGHRGGVYGYDAFNVDYEGDYFDDPYDLGDGRLTFRYSYNEPQFFGNQVLSFDTYLRENTAEGEKRIEDIMISNPEVMYNLFAIVSNDVKAGMFSEGYSSGTAYSFSVNSTLVNGALIDEENSKITFSGGDLAEPVTLPLVYEDNNIGYMGTSIQPDAEGEGKGRISVNVANPERQEGDPAEVTRQFVINGVNRYGDSFTLRGDITLKYIDYTANVVMGERGAELRLSFGTRDHGSTVYTGKYNTIADEPYSVTDWYGKVREGSYSVESELVSDPGTTVTLLTTPDGTLKPAVIRIERPGTSVTVDITDHEKMQVAYEDIGAGVMAATVTVTENTRFSYRYLDDEGEQVTKFIEVANIVRIEPTVIWDFSENDYTETADGVKFRYGSVTAYLIANGAELTDRYSGTTPKHTFNPGDPEVFTFSAEDVTVHVGGESQPLKNDVLAVLPITLYEQPDITGEGLEDRETPNVQVFAYKMDGSYSSEARLSLQLESARDSHALTDRIGYKVFGYVGNRASMTSLLRELGWAPAMRFEIELRDLSRVRLFVKEGLYATAPDYENGESDSIPGVTVTSRLITVTAKAAFTLFAVDSKGNCSAVAFDVTDVGLAPAPTVEKVVMTDPDGNSFVRAYITPPEGHQEFALGGSFTEAWGVESDGEYAGKVYVDLKDNDSYGIPYSFIWRENAVDGILNLAVTEINLREMSQLGDAVWSDNAARGAVTAYDVTATVTFSEAIAGVSAQTDYDADKLEFRVSGSTLTVVYSANHPAVRLQVSAANGSSVFLELGQVSCIDKSAPEITEVSRELAENGKSVLITLSSSVRASLNGFAGELGNDGKYYYERRITENGSFSYVFTAENGVSTTYGFTVSELVLTELTALFSLRPDGANAVSSVAELEITVGDVIYVNPLRDASLELGGAPVTVLAGRWTAVTVPEPLGGVRPYVILTDSYGNTLTQQLERIAVPDTTAPEIIIRHTTYSVRIGTDPEAARGELLSNFAAIDDTEGEITYSVSFDTDLQSIGIFPVEYTATDAAGNSATAAARLRVTSLREASVTFGGERIFREGSLIIGRETELVLGIDSSDLYYKVVIAEGVNTAAQMKPFGKTVKDYSLDDTLDLGTLAVGTYTLAIVNQERDYFLIYIAVVEPEE